MPLVEVHKFFRLFFDIGDFQSFTLCHLTTKELPKKHHEVGLSELSFKNLRPKRVKGISFAENNHEEAHDVLSADKILMLSDRKFKHRNFLGSLW